MPRHRLAFGWIGGVRRASANRLEMLLFMQLRGVGAGIRVGGVGNIAKRVLVQVDRSGGWIFASFTQVRRYAEGRRGKLV